jgi:hypothetical protein
MEDRETFHDWLAIIIASYFEWINAYNTVLKASI